MKMKELLLLLALATFSRADAEPMFSPEPGSPLRKTLMNTLRQPIMKALNQSVIFKIDWLQVKDGWAFIRGQPFQPGGQPVDYGITPYQDAIFAGVFDDGFCALLQWQEDKRWQVVVYAIGATDVVYAPWPKKYGAPRELFDLSRKKP
ncbi:MAG: hypothetical protein KDK04_15005 [Candidatus Competibacteraceae bacterium]|jgi:hypothetical protein|nr:hypothetical protein [Candidatus Competibacteraceae bacterium]